jgi:hypothetical protein
VDVSRLVGVLLVALLAGCGPATAAPGSPGTPTAGPSRHAPAGAYGVGVRTLTLDPGSTRPLPVTVWYPAAPGGGLAGRTVRWCSSATGWAACPTYAALTGGRRPAVAAPTYRTPTPGGRFSRADVLQPADGWRVRPGRLTPDGDPFAGRLGPIRVAAATLGGGHTAAVHLALARCGPAS